MPEPPLSSTTNPTPKPSQKSPLLSINKLTSSSQASSLPQIHSDDDRGDNIDDDNDASIIPTPHANAQYYTLFEREQQRKQQQQQQRERSKNRRMQAMNNNKNNHNHSYHFKKMDHYDSDHSDDNNDDDHMSMMIKYQQREIGRAHV